MLESAYQARLIDRIDKMLPGCIILKNDSALRQGIPDLLVLYRRRWALLEVKTSATAKHQPNQDYYVELARDMSYASFIYPENEEEVLSELQHALSPRRKSRVP